MNKQNIQRLLAVGASFAMVASVACGPKSGSKTGDQTFSGDTSTQVDENAFDENGTAEPIPAVLVFPEEAFRNEQPGATTPRPLQLPSVQSFKLGGQIDVYLVERHELPTISLDLNFTGGYRNDPANKVGLAGVCMDLMSESTKSLDKLQLQEALANIASRVNTYAGRESQGVRLATLTKNLDATLPLFRDVLLAPGFRDTDLNRMLKRQLESLKQAKASATSVARRIADSIAFGPRHSFGKIETEKSLQSIKTGDCVAFHKAFIKPRGAKLFIVGDMTKAQVVEKFSPLLKSWKGSPKRSARITKPQTRKGKIFFVDIPKSAQSVILVHQFGPKRTDRDYFATTMMGTALGGGFTSRIMMNLREDKGYSYGARATFGYTKDFGELNGWTTVRADATRQSVQEYFKEIRNLKTGEKAVTKAELSRDKNGAILSLPGQFANSRGALGRYRNLVYHGLPLDYYNGYVDGVSSVTLEDVTRVAAKHLRPSDAIVLVVGDGTVPQIYRNAEGKDVPLKDEKGTPVTLRGALEQLTASGELGRGELIILDADGNPAK